MHTLQTASLCLQVTLLKAASLSLSHITAQSGSLALLLVFTPLSHRGLPLPSWVKSIRTSESCFIVVESELLQALM